MPRFPSVSHRWLPLTAAAMAVAILACGPLGSTSALAADPPPSGDGWLPNATRQAEDMARSAGDKLGEWWNDATTFVTPSGPTTFLPAQISEDDKQFFGVLEAIGLKLRDVTVGKGVFPGATYRFVAASDPTDADIERAERLLRAYRDASDGFRARAKQRIARSTLDTVATAGFALTSMEVTLSPWPDASYQVSTRPRAEAKAPEAPAPQTPAPQAAVPAQPAPPQAAPPPPPPKPAPRPK